VAAKTKLDHGIFDDEVSEADGWKLQSSEYAVAMGVRAIAAPGHTAGHMSLFIELPTGQPVVLCGDAADLRENLEEEMEPGYCWQDNDTLVVASIRKLKAISQSENAELWPNHDFTAFRSWPTFPDWRD
jgi:N-acyl homoserine lactone hydrolase